MAIVVNKIPNNTNILKAPTVSNVVSKDMTRNFGFPEDYVELNITDPSGKNLFNLVPFLNYKIPGTFPATEEPSIQELEFNPGEDLTNLGLVSGDYILNYNILRPKIVKDAILSFFIKEISDDRTEIRLVNNNIPESNIELNTFEFINEIQSLTYFREFYINFGGNQLLPAVNIALDRNTSPFSVLIKLLEPLPQKYSLNRTLNIVDKISNSQEFSVSITIDPIPTVFPTLRGPNFNLELDNIKTGPTPYYNFDEITNFRGEFTPQLQQLLGQLSASNFAINVDYTDYENFIHFSSATRRLEGFRYKMENIELFTSQSSSAALGFSPSSILDAQNNQSNINKIIQSFDGYEQYLYYNSSSYSWPKQNSTKPYINYSITSSQAAVWYTSMYESASLYDDNNQNYILYTLPGYVTEDNSNELLFKFMATMGHMFDDIWIHIKAITELYQAKNSLTNGISKDLVYFALQSLGIDVYTDQDGKDVFKYLYGVDKDGNYLPQTGSWETLVSASNYQLPGQDIQKGIYKRLYHNLPLLLKSKGTTRFIQYLNTIFGIPSTIMSYIEYGGADKLTSSFEYEYDRFTYALEISGSNTIEIPWVYTSQSLNRVGLNNIAPNGIEFRFKAFTTASNILASNYATQSLFYNGSNYNLYLLYTNTGSNDSIYSGSIGDFGYLQFNLGSISVTSSTVPVFTTGSDGETSWYSVLVQRISPNIGILNVNASQTYDIYLKNNVWGETGHIASASLTTSTQNTPWYTNGTILTFGGGTYPFSGSIQEVRLWSNYIPELTFDSHVLNPESIEGAYTSSAYNDLTARFTLGNNLYTYNHFIDTEVYSTHPDQSTQILTASFSNFLNQNNYNSFTERYYADVANSGYANPIVNKVRIYSGSEYGVQLMPNKTIEVAPLIPITKDIHLLDAGLSPQDEINKAIISHFGSTYDLDDIIGNPSTSSYEELNNLQREFFKKFNNKYNYKDYIRLIEFFHNSLFRTLKDFTPARTNPATGIIIKPHLLERPLVYRPEPNVTDFNNEFANIKTGFISGSNGGNYSQSLYDIIYFTKQGYTTQSSDARDFFTGIFPGATVPFDDLVYQPNPFTLFKDTNSSLYSQSIWYHDYFPLLNNVSCSISNFYKKQTFINSQSKSVQVLEPSEIQKYNYISKRILRSKFEGSSTTSTTYTFFSEYDDFRDVYGKTAVIDKNTVKFAYIANAFTRDSGSEFINPMPERTNLYVKYLIDESGSLTDLVRKDYNVISEREKFNLYQVQNTFKQGEDIDIALFNNKNPSNQADLDGNKKIFAGGFRFHPILWSLPVTTTFGEFTAPPYIGINSKRPDLIYQLDPKIWPKGQAGIAPPLTSPSDYPVTQFQVFSKELWDVNRYYYYYSNPSSINSRINQRIYFYVERVGGGAINEPLAITFNVRIAENLPVNYYALPSKIQRNVIKTRKKQFLTLTLVIPRFSRYSFNSQEFRNFELDSTYTPQILKISNADRNTKWDFLVTDSTTSGNQNYLTFSSSAGYSSSASTEIFCSDRQAFWYPGFKFVDYYTGTLPTNQNWFLRLFGRFPRPTRTRFNFELNPGDIVRFFDMAGTGGFDPDYEFEITSVTPPNQSDRSKLSFKINGIIPEACTGSYDNTTKVSTLWYYVFSKKVPDETNIVIDFQKQFGNTSPGIIKNINLLTNIQDKIPAIVKEIKNQLLDADNNTSGSD
jgi:hypothetical protein